MKTNDKALKAHAFFFRRIQRIKKYSARKTNSESLSKYVKT